jgi:hypothetical protein
VSKVTANEKTWSVVSTSRLAKNAEGSNTRGNKSCWSCGPHLKKNCSKSVQAGQRTYRGAAARSTEQEPNRPIRFNQAVADTDAPVAGESPFISAN